MKKVLIALGIVIVVLIVALVILLANINSAVSSVVTKVVPPIIGADVELQDVSIRPLRGKVQLKGFAIKNPEGFKGNHAIKFEEFKISMNMRSAMTDKIHIHEIILNGLNINYELGLGKSNIGTILETLEGDKPKDEPKEKEEKPKEEPKKDSGKRVVIDHLVIDGSKVVISTKLTQGVGAPIPLPKIEMKDIGKDDPNGITVKEAILIPFKAITGAVLDVAKGSVDLLGKGAKETGALATDGAKAVGGAAAEGAKAVGGAAKKAAGGTLKGLKKVIGK